MLKIHLPRLSVEPSAKYGVRVLGIKLLPIERSCDF